MFTWVNRMFCKHEITILMIKGECVNACKKCGKKKELRKDED